MIVPLTAACVAVAAERFDLSIDAMWALRMTEGGRVGEVTVNRGGDGGELSRDIGPFQINDRAWLDRLTVAWRRGSRQETYQLLKNNGCANALAGAEVFSISLNQAHGDYGVAVGLYNAPRNPGKAEIYRRRFLRILLGLKRREISHES